MVESVLGRRYTSRGDFHGWIVGERLEARDAIERDILPMATSMDTACLCGSDLDTVLSLVDKWGFLCMTVVCGTCGLVRVNPRWSDDTYTSVYARHYWPLSRGSRDITKERFVLSIERAQKYFNFLIARVDLKGRDVLEIGCSYGAGLEVLKSESPARLVGYDYDRDMLLHGRYYTSLDLRWGGITEAITDGARYDLVILRHVVEHFTLPLQEVMGLCSLLKPGGLVFVEVPGLLSKVYMKDPLMYFDIFHTYSYCLETLRCLFSQSGFDLVAGTEDVLSLWRLSDTLSPLNWIEPNRAGHIVSFIRRMERQQRVRALVCRARHLVGRLCGLSGSIFHMK